MNMTTGNPIVVETNSNYFTYSYDRHLLHRHDAETSKDFAGLCLDYHGVKLIRLPFGPSGLFAQNHRSKVYTSMLRSYFHVFIHHCRVELQ
jgi:hypothetical protein